jgi:hypothetical protein
MKVTGSTLETLRNTRDPSHTSTRAVYLSSVARGTGETRSSFKAHVVVPVRKVVAAKLVGFMARRTHSLLPEGERLSFSLTKDSDGSIVEVDLTETIGGLQTSDAFKDDPHTKTSHAQLLSDIAIKLSDAEPTGYGLSVSVTPIENGPAEIIITNARSVSAGASQARVLGLRKTHDGEIRIRPDLSSDGVCFVRINDWETLGSAASISNSTAQIASTSAGADGSFAAVAIPSPHATESCSIMAGFHIFPTPLDRVSTLKVELVRADGTPYPFSHDVQAIIEFYSAP